MWCGVIGLYIFPHHLTGDIYTNFLQEELPAPLETVPLQTRRQMCYQHERAPPHFSQAVRRYLNHKFPSRWIGRDGTHIWPPQSPDLNPLDCHVWGYMKAMVCVHSRWTWEKNYSSKFLVLQEASTTLQCFISFQVLWSHKSESVFKQMEDTSNNLLECWTANL
jgi:hypothetical protein